MNGQAGRVRRPPPMVGRDHEAAILAGVLSAVGQGHSALALIEGEAGIGKTRLVQSLAEEASTQGFDVRMGGGGPLEQDRPFGPVADALGLVADDADPERQAIGHLLYGGTFEQGVIGPRPAELRYRIVDDITAHVERLAAACPLLLVVEDLHWADPSTLLVLHHLSRRLPHLPLALVLTARLVPRTEALAAFVGSLPAERLSRLALGGLADRATSELADHVVGARPGDSLLRWLKGAAGNPLFVLELLETLVRDDAIEVDGDLASIAVDWSPSSLRQVILGRLADTPLVALPVLRAAAVLGSTFVLDDVAVMLDEPSSALLDLLDEPLRSGIVVEAGGRLAFRHALVHDAVYHGIPGSGRQALHLQAARRLARAGRPPLEVARHFRIGARPGDLEAQEWLRRAAQHAAVRAPAVAVDLLEAGRSLMSPGDSARDEVTVDLAAALVRCGRLAEAIALLTELLERPRGPSVEAAAQLALVQALVFEGRLGEATAIATRALDEPGLPTTRHGRLLAEASLAKLLSGAIDEAAEVAERAEPVVVAHGDVVAISTVLAVQAWALGLRGHTNDAIATARRAVEQARSVPAPDDNGRSPELLLGILLMDGDRLEEAQALLGAALRTAEELGTVRDLPMAHWALGLGHFLAGDDDDAIAEMETGREFTHEVGTRISLVWADAILAHIHIRRDDLDAARLVVAEGESELARLGPQIKGDWLLWARALLHEIEGRPDLAHEVLRAAWDGSSALGVVAERPMLGPDLIRLCVSLDRRSEAAGVAADVELAAQLIGSSSARASALRCAGLADGDAATLLRSVDAFRAGTRAMDLAFACEDAGRALVAQGKRTDAIALFDEARHRYQASGAVRMVRRVSGSLRGLGVRLGHRGGQRRASTGWEALTDSERRVARLAAKGLTNPEIGERLFVSRRTVETHLSHAFGKLGLSSRVALAATMMKLEGDAREVLRT